jgi:hypothetical protein
VTISITGAGIATIHPDLLLGYESVRSTQSVVHDILQNPYPSVTLDVAGSRTGTMTLLFKSESAAATAETSLSQPLIFAFSSTEITSSNMNFVLSGNLTRSLDQETFAVWTVSFEWTETA